MTKDGTAEFIAVDARAAAIFDLIYPVGSIFATTGNAPARGTWEEIAKGRTLQGADANHAAGTMIAAGLPNITGTLSTYNSAILSLFNHVTGCFKPDRPKDSSLTYDNLPKNTSQYAADYCNGGVFDASKSNAIYGASSTVQPPAYIVRFYRRTT